MESSNPAVVAANGTVNAPLAGQPSIPVQLTATVSVRGVTATKTITVTVLPSTETAEQRAQRLAQRFVIPAVVESGTSLPAAPEGTTIAVLSATGGVTVAGTIVSASNQPVDAVITVRVTDPSTATSVDRAFKVRVLPAATTSQLLAYNRNATSVAEANNADVALSMHLALEGAAGWTPLNENYGIFFPKTSAPVPANGPTEGLIRSLRDPHVFYQADG